MTTLVMLAALVVHELIHFVLMPSGGRVFGLWPSRALPYVHRPGELPRRRSLVVLLGPFLIISVLPLVLALAGVRANEWLAFAVDLECARLRL